MTDNTIITANFKQRNSYSINTSVIPEDGSGGAISPASVVVLDGDDQAFEILSKGGYNIVEVKVDGELIAPSSSYKFINITENHTIEATFKSKLVISQKPVSHDSIPQINTDGHVVWHSDIGPKSDIYYLHSGSEENITEEIPGDHFYPQINTNGHIVWVCDNSTRTDIYYYHYDSTLGRPVVKNITQDHNLPSGHLPRINDSGHMPHDIYYYNGSTPFIIHKGSNTDSFTRLTKNNEQLVYLKPDLKINAEGDVVWSSFVDSNYEIYYYRRSSDMIDNLSNNNEADDKHPQINDNGYVVWQCDSGSESDIYAGKVRIQLLEKISKLSVSEIIEK
jgi:hypothetical protein